ncbi:ABC transporter ATP-binding protein [Paraburkholderia phenoliruptrix]|uniref:Spermidine/putrescine import ATP-binding protein PotA n=2 Tax=Paraburkholderia phenoliruptrix TaxID=252970 RepID=A0A6J5KD37_9BURK|nr:ATP-binding cassette domain-containing protein [Paraburkholderia phenoliruptrix]CAB4051896.1 Spermidine/putrescine import ATP-binding protein PotA [Paraburkholderia phenoliruptrix]
MMVAQPPADTLVQPRSAAQSPGMSSQGVRLCGISKFYENFPALKNVSIDIAPGEFLTLLGPSGSGKTTTMMAIAGFTDVTSGEVYIEGRRVDMLPPHKRNIGVVFQHLALFPHLSVQDNLAFPLRMRGVKEAAIAAKVRSALELVHLSAFADRLPNQLSGGQQQRVALARAIIFDPPVLLLDEPLSALDRKLRESMQNELKNLQRKLGVTTVMVTHDQEEALAVSDRIAVMNNGEVVQLDTPEMLYEKPNLCLSRTSLAIPQSWKALSHRLRKQAVVSGRRGAWNCRGNLQMRRSVPPFRSLSARRGSLSTPRPVMTIMRLARLSSLPMQVMPSPTASRPRVQKRSW